MSRAPVAFEIMQKQISKYNEYKSKVRVDVEIVSDHNFPSGDQERMSGLGTTTKLNFYISGKDDKELQLFNFSFIFGGFKKQTIEKEYAWAPGTEREQGTYVITPKLVTLTITPVESTPQGIDIPEGMKIIKCTVTLGVKYTGFVFPGGSARSSHLQAWDYLRSYILRTTSITLNNREFTRTRADLTEPSKGKWIIYEEHYISIIKNVEYEASPINSALNKEIVVTHLKM